MDNPRDGWQETCLFADRIFAHPAIIGIMLFGSCLSVEPGRKFFSSNVATAFNLLKHWKLPKARGIMLSLLVTVIASPFLPLSFCAPCSSPQR